uniref:NR LBD domain-containing protein n=1 Tax=Heterorhabditis bacteriophora TaxID=37862 RepID=A0A1I7WHU9_HETBA
MHQTLSNYICMKLAQNLVFFTDLFCFRAFSITFPAEARLQATRFLAEKPSTLLLEQVMVMSSTSETNQINAGSIPLNLVEDSLLHESSQPGPSMTRIEKQ